MNSAQKLSCVNIKVFAFCCERFKNFYVLKEAMNSYRPFNMFVIKRKTALVNMYYNHIQTFRYQPTDDQIVIEDMMIYLAFSILNFVTFFYTVHL